MRTDRKGVGPSQQVLLEISLLLLNKIIKYQ